MRDTWNSILEQSGISNVYQTFEWSYVWWENFGQNKKLFILVCQDAKSEVIGIAPLIIHRSAVFQLPLRFLQFISVTVSDLTCDYYDFIIKDEHRNESIQAILEYIYNNSNLWDVFFLENIPEWSPNYIILKDSLKKIYPIYEVPTSMNSRINNSICPYIPIDTNWDEYFSKLGKKTRKNCKEQRNRLNRIGNLEYNKISDPELMEKVLSLFFEMHKKEWEANGESSKFHRENIKIFYKEVAHVFFQKNWLDLSVLELDGKPLAIHFGFIYKRKLYYFTIAQDIAYNYYSPGKLLTLFSIQKSFKDGMNEFDFMNGDEAYKFFWTKKYRKNHQIRAYQKNFKGYLALIWIENIRKFLSGRSVLMKFRQNMKVLKSKKIEDID